MLNPGFVTRKAMVRMEETVRMAPSQRRAAQVVRAEQIRTRRENFIFPEQNSNAIRGSRMQ
ncbi:hypothetical protein L6R44_18930 [Enterobacter cloacae complex sp. ECC445]|uniref:hypothetical protein n=1 Tax=Enterobacter cloacae complex sp. ECC445 TaxID=2913213 RepID=UPI001F4853B4|nr:hypothetical protein [Enterobacter cloacae complex sp. ECC445]MCG0458144.1 hypothetical protein [Enterobacter cloacae complex sp. ECC445]